MKGYPNARISAVKSWQPGKKYVPGALVRFILTYDYPFAVYSGVDHDYDGSIVGVDGQSYTVKSGQIGMFIRHVFDDQEKNNNSFIDCSYDLVLFDDVIVQMKDTVISPV